MAATSNKVDNSADFLVLLYRRTIDFLTRARTALAARQLSEHAEALYRARQIVRYLPETLDFDEGGEVALQLERLYRFMLARLSESAVTKEPAPIDEVIELLTALCAGYQALDIRDPQASNLVKQLLS